MNRSISVVTTFHKKGYEDYGSKMIDTFLAQWPKTVKLFVYAEDCQVTQTAENLIVLDLLQTSPELAAFKEKWKNVPKANGDISNIPKLSGRKDRHKPFKWDAVRFSHKVYSIFHCANTAGTDLLLWMDADMICHSAINQDTILRLCPVDKDLCFLGRKGKFSECGLYAMNLQSQATQHFLKDFQMFYDDAENGIFRLGEWHDSFVFDAVRKNHKLRELDWSGHLITGEGHPLINCEWGAYLDHLKGDRKKYGQSKKQDLRVNRTEEYWSKIV
jgi:hypothetical protein